MKNIAGSTETKLNSESIDGLKNENAKLQHELEMANVKIKWYEEQLKLGAAKKYGRSSDSVDEGQVSFFNEAEITARPEIEEPAIEKIAYERSKKRGTNKQTNLLLKIFRLKE